MLTYGQAFDLIYAYINEENVPFVLEEDPKDILLRFLRWLDKNGKLIDPL